MKLINLLWITALIVSVGACVPAKKYRHISDQYRMLDSSYRELLASNTLLSRKVEGLQKDTSFCNSEVRSLMGQYNDLVGQSGDREQEMQATIADLRKRLKDYSLVVGDTSLLLSSLQQQLRQGDSTNTLLANSLETALLQYTENEQLEIDQSYGRISLTLREELLFRPGTATLIREGKTALLLLANTLKTYPDVRIAVEGHADSLEARSTRPGGSWEISAQRASVVVETLTGEFGVTPSAITATGWGATRPIYPNDTPSGRDQNRRIVIVLTTSKVGVLVGDR